MNERELFLSALDIEDPAARQAHLQSACADDADLLSRVESLLASHESQSLFLRTPVTEQLGDEVDTGIAATLLVGSGFTQTDSNPLEADPMQPNPNDANDEIPLGFLEPSTRPDSSGRLGHFEILEVVGRGAFGTVLRAFDEKLQRVVAIKVMALELAATSPARKRFLREAQSSAAIRHENVVSIYTVEEKPIPYLVMEYIPGETLQHRLDENGPLDVTNVLKLGIQIAEGLAAAHAIKLIHRDIKPGNILLESGMHDRVKITDFGLARTADDASMTQSGMIAGTPLYMAPEQALGQKLDLRADLFSFGSVLYQMVSGRPPFRAPTALAVLKRVAEETPRSIQEIIPETPQWLCDIISTLHAKNPNERYASAREVRELLEYCLSELQQGRVPQVVARKPPPKRALPAPPKPTTARTANRPPASFMAAAAAVLVLLIGLTITEAMGVTKLAVTVIRLSSGSGTLVIEIDDPTVQVAINGEEVTIRGTGVDELTLRPGQYNIAALKNGKPVKQELVTITRDGRTVVRMSLESDAEIAEVTVANAAAAGPHQWPPDAPPLAVAPFDAAQAKQHQQAWADYLGVPAEMEIDLGGGEKLLLVLIPPGEYVMGTDRADELKAESRKSDAPDWRIKLLELEGVQHRVRITRPFWLSRHEFTIGQFRRFTGETNYLTDAEKDDGGWTILDGMRVQNPELAWNKGVGYPQGDDSPVVVVSWNDAMACCAWLSKREVGMEFFLPTEAQWEYACRAGTTTLWHFGDNEADFPKYGWTTTDEIQKRTHPVGQLPPNVFGLHDMHGNAWEWCSDWATFEKEYYKVSPVDDPTGPAQGTYRIMRGGPYSDGAMGCRSGSRLIDLPDRNHPDRGFRVAAALSDAVLRAKFPAVAGLVPAIAPFDAAQAKEHQHAWAKYLGMPADYTNSIGMKLRLIPPGNNALGPSGPAASADPLFLGTTEVTVEQFRRFVEETKYQTEGEANKLGGMLVQAGKKTERNAAHVWSHADFARSPSHPVTLITWHDAHEFCAWLSRKEGRTYRLPTSAEWKWGERAGCDARFYFGASASALDGHAWLVGNSDMHTQPVGAKTGNPWGLADIYGNVWELCSDWQRDGKPVDSITAKAGPGNNDRIIFLGGGYSSAADDVLEPASGPSLIGYSHLGFRVALVGDLKPTTVKQDPSSPPTFKNSLGMEFVIVPKGKSWLGGGKDRLSDKEVEIPADFYLGKYEVTQEEWEQVMGENPSHFSRTGNGKYGLRDFSDGDLKRFPVENVSWDQCQLFVAKLNMLEEDAGWVYRLPTEAEWEYACRGGPKPDRLDSAFDFYFAKPTNSLLPEMAHFKDSGKRRTCPVGLYKPNQLGLYDLHGNAWEWCQDEVLSDPKVSRRAIRGGSCFGDAGVCTAIARHLQEAPYRDYGTGLRVARVPSAAPVPEVKTPPVSVAPFTDADVKRIAAMPAAEQVEEVRKELMKRNPGLDGNITRAIEGNVVTQLRFVPVKGQDAVTDLAPVRALAGLTALMLDNCYDLADLTPLKGLPLTRLSIGSTGGETHVRDLEPLKGMPLKDLSLINSSVPDLEPLKGMSLKGLNLFSCDQVRSLEPLHGMPLSTLYLDNCRQIEDFTPLTGMPLTRLFLGGTQIRDLESLKGMKLTDLHLHVTRVRDLAPLKDMPLKRLSICDTGVTDLSPLEGMPLEVIHLTPKHITEGLDILRDMKTLTTIGISHVRDKTWPAAEFWERYDKGEFRSESSLH